MKNIKRLSDKIKNIICISAVTAGWTPVLILGAYQIIQYPKEQEELRHRLLSFIDTNRDNKITNNELATWGG